MKRCRICFTAMIAGGACGNCGHEDDDFPTSMLAVGFVIAASVLGIAFVLMSYLP